MVTLSTWRARMDEDMRLRDFRQRTREGYALAVRQFVDHVKREPRTYTEEDVRAYVLHLRDERKLSPSTVNIGARAKALCCGVRRPRRARRGAGRTGRDPRSTRPSARRDPRSPMTTGRPSTPRHSLGGRPGHTCAQRRRITPNERLHHRSALSSRPIVRRSPPPSPAASPSRTASKTQ